MAEQHGVDDVRQVMDRVFFNALLIVQGVVLGYGAGVFVKMLRHGPPWASGQDLAVYLAWLASILFATLALVSQSFGSHLTPLRPTTPVILLTIALAICEFVGFGLLEPQAGESATIRSWLLAVAAQAFAALLFVATVLHYSASHRHPGDGARARAVEARTAGPVGGGDDDGSGLALLGDPSRGRHR